jgi:hypothetical protein
MLNNIYNQLFIEGENNQLYIYIHLSDLCEKRASKILDKYVENFKNHDFEKINVSFWDVNIPGEHLSSFRKTSDRAIGKILKGFKYIDSYFDFRENQKVIAEPKLIS